MWYIVNQIFGLRGNYHGVLGLILKQFLKIQGTEYIWSFFETQKLLIMRALQLSFCHYEYQ